MTRRWRDMLRERQHQDTSTDAQINRAVEQSKRSNENVPLALSNTRSSAEELAAACTHVAERIISVCAATKFHKEDVINEVLRQLRIGYKIPVEER